MEAFLLRNSQIKLTLHDETKKSAHDSQIVRAKENLKLSHGGSSYRQASGANPPAKVLRQSRHRVWGLTHRRAIKEETIVINCDGFKTRHADCRMISKLYPTFYNLFELITKIKYCMRRVSMS